MASKKNLQSAAAAMGRKGGKAKVPKGFAMRTPEELAELGRAGAVTRWKKAKA